MKKIYCLLFSILTAISINAQNELSKDQWLEDLQFLHSTIHNDYDFLFVKTTPEIFNIKVEELRKSIPDMESHEIIVGLAKIVSLFEYGHTSISLSGWSPRKQFSFHQMPYNLKQFNDGVYIQGTKKEYERALGAKVLKVESIDIKEALSAVKPAFPVENDQFFKAYGMSFLGNAEILHAQRVTPTLKTNITLTLEKDEKIFTQIFKPIENKRFPGAYTYIREDSMWLDARDNSKDPLYLKNLDKIYYYEYLPEHNAVYVRQSQIQDDPTEDIPTFYNRVFKFIEENKVDKLILDVRLNGGGNNYKNKPVVTGIIKSRINVPGKFFVITSGQTFSACQNLVNELDNYTNAIFVGEPTGENINFYGDNRQVILPNSKIPVRLSWAWWQDKPQWEGGPWMAPHIAVDMSFEQYVNNEDPVLQATLDFNDDNFILDPMGYLTNLYTSGQVDKVMTEAVRMVNDPVYKFFDFEGEFNKAGYNLLNGGEVSTAIEIFTLVTGLFPDSANAWDSLAEGYWKSGNKEKAIELYNKAISMDPDGPTGENAKRMLDQLKE